MKEEEKNNMTAGIPEAAPETAEQDMANHQEAPAAPQAPQSSTSFSPADAAPRPDGYDRGEPVRPGRQKLIRSTLDNLSNRLDDRFNGLDTRRKGAILLGLAAAVFTLGLFYLYRLLSLIL